MTIRRQRYIDKFYFGPYEPGMSHDRTWRIERTVWMRVGRGLGRGAPIVDGPLYAEACLYRTEATTLSLTPSAFVHLDAPCALSIRRQPVVMWKLMRKYMRPQS